MGLSNDGMPEIPWLITIFPDQKFQKSGVNRQPYGQNPSKSYCLQNPSYDITIYIYIYIWYPPPPDTHLTLIQEVSF